MKQTDEVGKQTKIKTTVLQFIGSSLTVHDPLFSVGKS